MSSLILFWIFHEHAHIVGEGFAGGFRFCKMPGILDLVNDHLQLVRFLFKIGFEQLFWAFLRPKMFPIILLFDQQRLYWLNF